jgi:hypothetical protein
MIKTIVVSSSQPQAENRNTSPILCYYQNATPKLQIVKIRNNPDFHFERVLFPQQRLFFEASPEAQLEIYTGSVASAVVADTIPCHKLKVIEDS